MFGKMSNAFSFLAILLFTSISLTIEILAQELVVTSRHDDKVAFINLKTGEIEYTISTGSFPHEIIKDKGSGYAYVPSYGGNRISKIDLRSRKIIKDFEIEDHRGFHDAVLMNQSLWVTSELDKLILEVNPESGSIKNKWPTKGYRSHMIAAVPALSKLYVSNIDSGSVSIIDTKKNSLKVIKTGAGAEGIDVSPDEKQVWVSNRAENTIAVIDVQKDEVIKKFKSEGDFPVKLKFNPNGSEVWVTNNRSGSVSVFQTNTYKLIKLIEVGVRPLGIEFSPNGEFGYISKPGSNEIIEIAIPDNYKITRTIKTLPSPDGLIWINSKN